MSDLRPYDYGNIAGEVFSAQVALNRAIKKARASGFDVMLELSGSIDRVWATLTCNVIEIDNNSIDKTPE